MAVRVLAVDEAPRRVAADRLHGKRALPPAASTRASASGTSSTVTAKCMIPTADCSCGGIGTTGARNCQSSSAFAAKETWQTLTTAPGPKTASMYGPSRMIGAAMSRPPSASS